MSFAQSLQLGLITAIFIACLALWNLVFARLSSGHDIVRYEPRRVVHWSALDVGIVFLGIIALMAVWSAVIVQLPAARDQAEGEPPAELTATEKGETGFRALIATGIAMTAGMWGAAVWLRARGASAFDLGFDQSQWGADIGRGVAGFAVISVPLFGLQWALTHWIPPEHAMTDVFFAGASPVRLWITAFVAVLVAPITEEFLFRVVLQGWLEKLYSERKERYAAHEFASVTSISNGQSPIATENSDAQVFDAHPQEAEETIMQESEPGPDRPPAQPGYLPVLISSFLFALVHLNSGPSALPLFFFALVLGYLYRQTHRIWPSIFTHMSLNAFSTFMVATGAG